MAAFFQPAFRSRRFGHHQLTASAIVKIGLTTWLVPALFGILGILLFLPVSPLLADDSRWVVVPVFLGFLALSPLYGVVLVPAGLLIGAWGLRWGVAGWAYAALLSVALTLGVGALLGGADPSMGTFAALASGVIFAPVALVHAMVLWSATRHFCPDALRSPETGP